MEIRLRDLRKLIVEMILVEGRAQDEKRIEGIKEKYAGNPHLPKAIKKIEDALFVYKMGNDLKWIVNYFLNTEEGQKSDEPIADVVNHINNFKKQRARMEKHKPGSSNLKKYTTLEQLSDALKKSRGMLSKADLSSVAQTDIVGGALTPEGDRYDLNKQGEFYPWAVYLPKSRDASCTIGENTTWCTSIQLGEGNNLFYNYVIRDSFFLFYLQYQGNEQQAKDHELNDSESIICLGYMPDKGKVYFPEEGEGGGYITVDKNNHGVSRQRYFDIINKTTSDSSLADKILSSIDETVKKYGGKHPAKQNLIEIVNNPEKLSRELKGKSLDAILDFVSSATYSDDTNIPHNIFTEVVDPLILPPKSSKKVEKVLQNFNSSTGETYNQAYGELIGISKYYKRICVYRKDYDMKRYLFMFALVLQEVKNVLEYQATVVGHYEFPLAELFGDLVSPIVFEIMEEAYDTFGMTDSNAAGDYIEALDLIVSDMIDKGGYEVVDSNMNVKRDIFDYHEASSYGNEDDYILYSKKVHYVRSSDGSYIFR